MKKIVKKAQSGLNTPKYDRDAAMKAINSMPKTTPAQDSTDRARYDSLQKANRPTWLKAVDNANMDVVPKKQKNGGKMEMGGSLKKIASGKKMAKTSVKMAKKKNDIMMSKSQTMKMGGKAKKK